MKPTRFAAPQPGRRRFVTSRRSVAAGLALASLLSASLPAAERPGRGVRGPWEHDVGVWRVGPDRRAERVATFERAGVATVAGLSDGRLIAAHQHFPEAPAEDFDKVAVRFSTDEGSSWSAPRTIAVDGLPEGMRFPFDPTLVPLPDGRVRLYFTSVRGRTFQDDVPAIYSAVSGDGVRYGVEPGARFAIDGRIVIDCAVVLHRGTFHLFAPDNGPAPRPGDRGDRDEPPEGVGYHATSDDGLTFRRVDDVRIDGPKHWLGCAVSDGTRIRFYGTGAPGPRGGGVWAASSEDGRDWSPLSPVEVPAADPGVVALRDGGLLVVGTGGPRPGTPPRGAPMRDRPPVEASGAGGRWIHPIAKPLAATKNGPFVLLEDGRLLVVEKDRLRTSADDGATWSEPGPEIASGVNLGYPGHVGQIVKLRSGTLVLLYLDFDGYRFSWDDAKGEPKTDCLLELWAIRSADGGTTWTDRQRLLGGYNADFMGLVQAREGQVVATVEHLSPELRRWVACSFVSRDDGKTWERGNWIDLGGHGHHDGATEPMVAELADGRMMMLIRTSLGQLWRAYSDDGGRYWRVLEPSGLDASSAPGWLLRLRSGRLVLAWNRSHPQGRPDWPKGNWPGPAFEHPASLHREELSISVSEDEGRTWRRPLTIAREAGAQLSYPYIFERSPGVLWVFTRYTYDAARKETAPVAVEIREDALVEELGR